MSDIDKFSERYSIKPQIERIKSLENLNFSDKWKIFKELKENFIFFYKLPVKYDRDLQAVVDDEGTQILDIRGWGKIQYFPEPEKKQDLIGLFVVALINKEYEPKLEQ